MAIVYKTMILVPSFLLYLSYLSNASPTPAGLAFGPKDFDSDFSTDSNDFLLPEQQRLVENVEDLKMDEKFRLRSLNKKIRNTKNPNQKAALEAERQRFIVKNNAKIEAALNELVKFDLAHFDAVTADTIELQLQIHGPTEPPKLRGAGGRVRGQLKGPPEELGTTGNVREPADLKGSPAIDNGKPGASFPDPISEGADHGFDASSQQSVIEHSNLPHGAAPPAEHVSPTEHVPLTAHE